MGGRLRTVGRLPGTLSCVGPLITFLLILACFVHPIHAGQLQQLRDDVRGTSSKDNDQSDNADDSGDNKYSCSGTREPRCSNHRPSEYLPWFLGSFLFLDDYLREREYRQQYGNDSLETRYRQPLTPMRESPDYSEPQATALDRIKGWPRRTLQITGVVATSPFWLPRYAIDDQEAKDVAFLRFPYQHGDGYMLVNEWDDNARFWSVRLRSDYAEDFDDLSRISGHMLLSTTSRWGIDVEMNYLQERLPDDQRDHLWLYDCNLVYRFAQSKRSQWRTGLGVNWLTDNIGTEYGLNFTYGFDFYPRKPFVLSTELDWGTLGNAQAFHFRTTAGAVIYGIESYVGYEYRDIDSFQFNGLIAGVRVWF